MTPSVRLVAPGRLQIREGGGCLSVFGLPFFGAGIFMMLAGLGIVPMSNDGEVTRWTWLLLGVMGIVFTLVGGGLVFRTKLDHHRFDRSSADQRVGPALADAHADDASRLLLLG